MNDLWSVWKVDGNIASRQFTCQSEKAALRWLATQSNPDDFLVQVDRYSMLVSKYGK